MAAAAHAYRRVAEATHRDQLIVEHVGYVRHVFGRLVAELPPGVDRENLEAAGLLGLVEAAHHYDARRGVEFKTFAYRRIRGAMLDELRRNCPLPQSMLEIIASICQAEREVEPPASAAQLAAASGLSLKEVEQGLEAMRLAEARSLGEEIIDSRQADDPFSLAQRHELQQTLADGIERLPERQRLVITLYYLEDLRLKEIGSVLKLSESRVSRLLAEAEAALKHWMKTEEAP